MNDAPTPKGSDQPNRGPDIERLLALLEATNEGSWELDSAIEAHVGEWKNLGGWWREHKVTGVRERYTYQDSPRYTTSLDAAVTLVPEECAFHVGCEIDFTPTARVFGQDIHADEYAATPAIALCIAALKARAQLLKSVPSLSPTPARGASSKKPSPPQTC